MDVFVSMQVFKEVAEFGSFIRAAEKLQLSPAMTSKHIQSLEARLGVRLLHRTSRRVSLTDEGRIYYSRGSEILEELDALEAELSSTRARPRGLLRVAAPAWLHNERFVTALCRFRETYPEVKLDLLLGDRMVDLIEDGIDIALRVTTEPHETLFARRICEVPVVIAGSPAYLERKGCPRHPEELTGHDMLVNSSQRGEAQHVYLEGDTTRQVRLQPVLTSNSTDLLARAAALGMGLALLPQPLLGDPILAQTLKVVLPDFRPPSPYYLFALYSSRRYQAPKVRRFIDFMVETYGDAERAA